MRNRMGRALSPWLLAGALSWTRRAALRRMEHEYATTDTFTGPTVVGMYAAYGGHAASLGLASRYRVWPLPLAKRSAERVGKTLAVGGCAVAIAGAFPFGAGAQLSGTRPGTLHGRGVYRFSRNPQYLGLGIAATGIAVAARSGLAALIATNVWSAYRRWVVTEEEHLMRVFGDEYLNYRNRVPRWAGVRCRTGPRG